MEYIMPIKTVLTYKYTEKKETLYLMGTVGCAGVYYVYIQNSKTGVWENSGRIVQKGNGWDQIYTIDFINE